MNRTSLRIKQIGCRGTVSVEAALVTPLLLTLLFGIVEFGFIFKDLLLLNHGAREGARAAALGATTDEIGDRILSSLPTLDPEEAEITLEYRTYADGWSNWTVLGNYDGENYAPAGSQVRVTLSYQHPLACGPFFSSVVGEPGDTTVPLTSGMVMTREQ